MAQMSQMIHSGFSVLKLLSSVDRKYFITNNNLDQLLSTVDSKSFITKKKTKKKLKPTARLSTVDSKSFLTKMTQTT